MTGEDIKRFRFAYNCLINTSSHQYSKPIVKPIGVSWGSCRDELTVEVEPGIDVTFMKEEFHQMVRDAERGREARKFSEWNPAVQEAYDRYRVLLELTKQNRGMSED